MAAFARRSPSGGGSFSPTTTPTCCARCRAPSSAPDTTFRSYPTASERASTSRVSTRATWTANAKTLVEVRAGGLRYEQSYFNDDWLKANGFDVAPWEQKIRAFMLEGQWDKSLQQPSHARSDVDLREGI